VPISAVRRWAASLLVRSAIRFLPIFRFSISCHVTRPRPRGRSAEERRAIRQAETKPLVEKLKAWLKNRLIAVSEKSTIATAIRLAFIYRWALTD
jgi:Transposase IS66 family